MRSLLILLSLLGGSSSLKLSQQNPLNSFLNSFKKPSSSSSIDELKLSLTAAVAVCQPNGIQATDLQREEVNRFVEGLESVNPTRKPALSPLMNGFWRMSYTDFTPAAPSSGQLGPFVGDVYQDLEFDGEKGIIKNILDIKFPPLTGALIAKQRIKDSSTWYASACTKTIYQFLLYCVTFTTHTIHIHITPPTSYSREIEFDRVGNKIAGIIPLPTKRFIPGDQIR